MDTKCPYCGAKYEVNRNEIGTFTNCEICGGGFTIQTNQYPQPNTQYPTPLGASSKHVTKPIKAAKNNLNGRIFGAWITCFFGGTILGGIIGGIFGCIVGGSGASQVDVQIAGLIGGVVANFIAFRFAILNIILK